MIKQFLAIPKAVKDQSVKVPIAPMVSNGIVENNEVEFDSRENYRGSRGNKLQQILPESEDQNDFQLQNH